MALLRPFVVTLFCLLCSAAVGERAFFESVTPAVSKSGTLINLRGQNLKLLTYFDEEQLKWFPREGVSIKFQPIVPADDMGMEGFCEDMAVREEDPFHPQPEQFRSPLVLTCRALFYKSGEYEILLESKRIWLQDAGLIDRSEDEDDFDVFEDIEVINIGLQISIVGEFVQKDDALRQLRDEVSIMGLLRSDKPQVTGILPNTGSPNGGQLITIVGHHFASQNLDVAGLNDDSVPDDGEDFEIWFEKDGDKVWCETDRMFNIMTEQMGDKDSVICRTRRMKAVDYKLKMKIDGKLVQGSPTFKVRAGYAPEISHIFPSPSAPARDRSSEMTTNAYWTAWADIDSNTDGSDTEDLGQLFRRMWKKRCMNPIQMQVWDVVADKEFTNSKNFNQDGQPTAEIFNLWNGFKCTNAGQPDVNPEGVACSNYKVRYQCLNNVIDIQAHRMFTDLLVAPVSTKANQERDIVNHISRMPFFTAEDGVIMGSCVNTLDEESDSAALKLPLTKISGDAGIIRCLPDVEEPGTYNVTYSTFDQGNSVTKSYEHSYLQTNPLNGTDVPRTSSFEVFPEVYSVSPSRGSLNGGTLVTISGAGFETSYPETNPTSVLVGDTPCHIESLTKTEIKCSIQTPKKLREKDFGLKKSLVEVRENFCHKGIQFWNGLLSNLAECEAKCELHARCELMSWHQSEKRCRMYHGYNPSAKCKKENVHIYKWLNHWGEEETHTCYQHQGESYVGKSRSSSHGACAVGTFCRNPTPEVHKMPYCHNGDQNRYCDRITHCSDRMGPFAGHRGTRVQFGGKRNDHPQDFWKQHASSIYSWDTHELLTAFYAKENRYPLSARWMGPESENYIGRQRFYFVAPKTGKYKLLMTCDNYGVVWRMYSTGHRSRYISLTAYPGPWTFDKYEAQKSKTFSLKEGEFVGIESSFREDTGGDYSNIGIQYVMESNENLHLIKGKRFFKDNQEWHFKSDASTQVMMIYFKYNWTVPGGYNGEVDANGDIPDKYRLNAPVYRLKFCGDEGHCRTSANLGHMAWEDDGHKTRATWIANRIKNTVFSSSCKYLSGEPSTWSYLRYENDFESRTWPGSTWLASSNVFCGKEYFRMNQGTHIWHKDAHGEFFLSVPPPENFNDEPEQTVTDLCLAIRGEVRRLRMWIRFRSFKHWQDKGGWWDNWLDVINDESYYMSPDDGSQWGHFCFDLQTAFDVEGTESDWDIDWDSRITVKHITLYSHPDNYNSQDPDRKERFKHIHVDNLLVGTTLVPTMLEQTAKAVQYSGIAPNSISVKEIEKNPEDSWIKLAFDINDKG